MALPHFKDAHQQNHSTGSLSLGEINTLSLKRIKEGAATHGWSKNR